jgi:hypothetical protein
MDSEIKQMCQHKITTVMLGVISKKDGLAGGWMWSLPEKEGGNDDAF